MSAIERLEAEVGNLKGRLDDVQEGLERNNQSTAALREDVARLRGEINGTLPRIDRNVELLFEQVRTSCERTEAHEEEITILFKGLNGKADKEANEAAHSRLWFFMKISLLAIATAAAGMLLLKAFGA